MTDVIAEVRAVLREHMDLCEICTAQDLCAEADPLERAIQEMFADSLRASVRCSCGAPAAVRLSYVRIDGQKFTTAGKCPRCADKTAFAVLAGATFFVTAERI